jgi:hypothetical protein
MANLREVCKASVTSQSARPTITSKRRNELVTFLDSDGYGNYIFQKSSYKLMQQSIHAGSMPSDPAHPEARISAGESRSNKPTKPLYYYTSPINHQGELTNAIVT